MSDEQQTGTGQITCVEAVAIRIVRAGPEVGHSPSTIDRSLVEAAAIERQTDPEASRANGQGSQAIEVEQSRFPMTPESAVWNGEVKAPSPEEALCCLLPRDNGRLRVGILGGILIGVPAIAWWAGVLDARRFLNSDTAPAPLQQIALPESAPIKIDKQIISKTTDAQTPSTAGSEPGSKAGESELSAPTDEGDVARAHPVEPQKTILTKPAVAPHARENKPVTSPIPVPETKPKTIEGWSARAVTGRTAVLQGPTGVWNVALGDTVPGAGRIESIVRWGNHWIVATSRGLITTD